MAHQTRAGALLTAEEVEGPLWQREGPSRRLHVSAAAFEKALERHGVLRAVRARGFSALRVTLDTAVPAGPALRLHGRKGRRTHLLLELVLSACPLPALPGVGRPFRVLVVEWLLVQDPTASFTDARPALPGQEHPGLGITSALRAVLAEMCAAAGLDGLLSRPAHYHNAAVAARHGFMLDPAAEGRLRAMQRVLDGLPLSQASHAVDAGAIRDGDGAPVRWVPSEQVLPVGDELRACFASSAYVQACARARDALDLRLAATPPS